MLSRFVSSFPPDGPVARDVPALAWSPALQDVDGYVEISAALGHGGHGGGRVFLLDAARGAEAAELLSGVFPQHSTRSLPFARDWLGRIYAVDLGRVVAGEPQVKLFELAVNRVLDVDESLRSFFGRALVDEPDLYLEQDLYEQWRRSGAGVLGPDECASFTHPVFLGGDFTTENLEVGDLSVFWHTTGQLIDLTRGLPPGTTIGGFTVG